ncbi:MAG: DEAD/DEAH box helicase [Geminicoccaceae bacterium]
MHIHDTSREPFPHQNQGAAFLASPLSIPEPEHSIDFKLLLDDMGLGKTATAILAADQCNVQKILVICPAVARINWARELQMWQRSARSVLVLEGAKNIPTLITPDVVVISQNALTSKPIVEWLHRQTFELLIIDEAQGFKSMEAKRTQSLYGKSGLARKIKKVWLLSGTICPNNIGELHSHFYAMAPEAVQQNSVPMSYRAFIDRFTRYTMGDYGPRFWGSKNTDELKQRIRPYILRRRLADVRHELPSISWNDVSIGRTNAHIKKIEKELRTRHGDELAESVLGTGSGQIPALRRLLGEAKAPLVTELLADELKDGLLDKVVVFAWHKNVIHTLAEGLKRFGVRIILGPTPSSQRQSAIDAFQTDPHTRVFIGQLQACSTAITLTSAHHVCFAEQSWSPADNAQAAKRCHRIGQKNPVMVRMISLAGSLDEAVNQVLRRKTQALSEINL